MNIKKRYKYKLRDVYYKMRNNLFDCQCVKSAHWLVFMSKET